MQVMCEPVMHVNNGVGYDYQVKMFCVLQLYTINKEGLICDHKQIWLNMTALQGIKLALTPSKQPR